MRSATGFHVVNVSYDQVDRERWDRFLDACPDATYFQSPEWMGALLRAFPRWQGNVFVASDGNGEWQAALPWVATIRSRVRTVLSMPLGTYGGPLVPSGGFLEAGAELCLCLQTHARSWNTRGVLMTEFGNRALASMPDHSNNGATNPYTVFPRVTHVLDLSGGSAAVWEGRFDHQRRRQASSALRRGLVVRRAAREEDWLAYADIYADISREWKSRCRVPRSFFLHLARLSSPHAHLWVAEHEGEVVAGNLSFLHRDQVVSFNGTMRKDHASFHPAVALHHATIEEACAAGCRSYHLGPSPGLLGAARFKEQFGSEAHTYHLWASLSTAGRVMERIRPSITRACRG